MPAEFSAAMINAIVCSNSNRAAILYLLSNSQKKEMQAEKISQSLGVSHRTALYHLNILEDCGVVEVRKHRKKGDKLVRSVWGLAKKNDVGAILQRIVDEFGASELDKMVNINGIGRRRNGS